MSTAESRRCRLSIFAPGETDKTACPQKHHACKTRERAEKLFAGYVARNDGRRVIMHYGKLRANSFRIIRDTHPEPRFFDAITSKHTAFATFDELLNAPAYFPSLNIAHPDLLRLADAYDHVQAMRGNSRRVHRYDNPSPQQMVERERWARIQAEFGVAA